VSNKTVVTTPIWKKLFKMVENPKLENFRNMKDGAQYTNVGKNSPQWVFKKYSKPAVRIGCSYCAKESWFFNELMYFWLI
jgi:hypothetical protein